ncbi:MAG: hypothetical protein AAB784_02325 [Patescibacteria group bacterium]
MEWIKDILESEEIRYQISGGFAAHVYGSTRPVNDIDIAIPDEVFPKLYERVKEYVIYGPKRGKDMKWDIYAMVLNYKEQEIDFGGAYTTKLSLKDPITREDTDTWIDLSTDFNKSVMMEFEGMTLPLEDPRSLAEYKKHLNGEHQIQDVKAVEKFVEDNSSQIE